MADDITAFLVKRDADGNVEPYEVKVTGITDQQNPLFIKILPTTLGSLKGLKDPNSDAVQWSIDDKIEYVRRHVVEPDFSQITADDMLEKMTMWDLDMILISAVQNGGPMRSQQKEGRKGKGPTKRSGRSSKK